ncbi:MAG: asparagine synthase (glutamine-hydrolyzing) [Gemmatimonadales bacterium]
MCGLAGRFHPTALPTAAGWHERADSLLAHRGPDGRGHFRDEHCELVFRRLALIDLSPSGQQPMANEDGSIQVVFNGEIYNHPALRSELKSRGHRFRGSSDTEVLVHLYEDLGAGMVSRLRGIFAFALYDRARASLLLARDRFGVKPLFYATHDGEWVFASEMKAILALPGFRPRLDRQAVYDFLGLGYVPEPATGFANIHALPKGSTLHVTGETERITEFHRVAAQPNLTRRLSAATDEVSRALLDAVKAQSVADVPVAALLSGGIDSSLVVAAHGRAGGGSIETFNVRFPDRSHDETELALAVAEQCGTRHHTIDLADSALTPDTTLGLIRHFDQPFADTSLIPMYWISKAVRERGIICTLSGDGGDEAFGGYARFWRANRLIQLLNLPAWARHTTEKVGAALESRTRNWGRQVFKAVELARAGQDDSAILIAGLSNYLNEAQKRSLVLPEACDGLQPVYRHFDGYEPRGVSTVEELSLRLTESVFRIGLPSDMLRKVDMMSMRASIEVRVPLLDENVVALGLTLPHHLKTTGHTGKRVLRALAAQWLPPRVVSHPKRGFGIPLDVMVPAGFYTVLDDLLLSPDARTRAFLDRATVEQWLGALRRARDGRSFGGAISREGVYFRVFMALSLELWLRDYNLSW